MIALPLQGVPRTEGNSVFVDERFQPYNDQWSFLSGLGKISLGEARRLVFELTKGESPLGTNVWNETLDENGEPEPPWLDRGTNNQSSEVGQFPDRVCVVLSNMIYIEKNGFPSPFIQRLQALAMFQNPDFYKTQAMRLPTYGKPRVIGCFEDYDKYLAIPRGCYGKLSELMKAHQVELVVSDERNPGCPIDVSFCGTLSMLQDGPCKINACS